MAQLLGLGTLYWWCRTSACFGVAFGNLFLGIPFSLDSTLRSEYSGSFFALLNPFALVCGIVSLSMLCAHGGAWLMLRTDGALKQRSAKATQIMAAIFLVCFLVIGAWLYFGQVPGYSYAAAVDPNAALNPSQRSSHKQQPRLDE